MCILRPRKRKEERRLDFEATRHDVVRRALRALAPEAALRGSTSCLGVMTEKGFHSADGVEVTRIRVSGTLGHAFDEALSSLGYTVRRQ